MFICTGNFIIRIVDYKDIIESYIQDDKLIMKFNVSTFVMKSIQKGDLNTFKMN